ncbi:hypothetical protein M501DRAFT_1003035 [Patellaria atrata CBS 101060]|uniref:Uncharacterized protein n=1 Tax=Patellaria atrata CBS 101060 TaxID=1346257 RepID=A0A9P4SD61_9PEZI|nr:hypothetical protein M501DRAFT_1003035 [Patellaria atrata CBS 101060]
MQASLTLIVVTFIRRELALGNGIPFGAIFGSVQFSSIVYLWSKEFAGTLKARFSSSFTKWDLLLMIIVGSILFTTVGRSSAIAMRPRLDKWPDGGTEFYLNATEDELWPLTLNDSAIPATCANITLSTTCISRDWVSISEGLLPFWPNLNQMTTMAEFFGLPSKKSMKQFYKIQM